MMPRTMPSTLSRCGAAPAPRPAFDGPRDITPVVSVMDTPVLVLTARDTLGDKLAGFAYGADDYVVKPFAIAELTVRVRVALRHSDAENANTVLSLSDLELDQEAHRVTRCGAVVSLSPTEYKLLRYLLLNSGRVLTRAQLCRDVLRLLEANPDWIEINRNVKRKRDT